MPLFTLLVVIISSVVNFVITASGFVYSFIVQPPYTSATPIMMEVYSISTPAGMFTIANASSF